MSEGLLVNAISCKTEIIFPHPTFCNFYCTKNQVYKNGILFVCVLSHEICMPALNYGGGGGGSNDMFPPNLIKYVVWFRS